MDLMRGLRTHPHTGEPVKPLYTRPDGRHVWPVMGASPDDPSNGGGTDGEQGGTGSEGGEGEEEGEGGSGSDGEKPVSRAEFDRLQEHLRQADKKRADAEAALKKIEDAKKDDLTKAQERVAELEKANEAQGTEIAQLRLDNAFLRSNEVTWVNPKHALKLAEAEGYLEGIIKDGKVDEKALGGKLKEFAKANEHLVKKGTEEQQTPPPPSGGAVGSGGKGGKDGGVDETALKGRYRSLAR